MEAHQAGRTPCVLARRNRGVVATLIPAKPPYEASQGTTGRFEGGLAPRAPFFPLSPLSGRWAASAGIAGTFK